MSLRVIYIDDELGLCQMFEDNFADDGVEILAFTDPASALIEIRRQAPDLVIVDYRLPGITGDQVAEQLPVGIPVALVSGDLTVDLKVKFERIFAKPFDFEEMRQFILSFRRS
jgi:two-component system, response regulator, stage 0 sporulation protein F